MNNFRFYIVTAIIALFIHHSLSFIPLAFYKAIQPYLLALFFCSTSFYLYIKTKHLELIAHLKIALSYIVFYVLSAFIELILGLPHPYLIAEIFIQLALCITSVLIGFGLAFIKDRLSSGR